MTKTIISAIRNEEYLLPWWLNHHKKMFDHGIIINCDCTDNSISLVKEICPTWEIIDSRYNYLAADENDIEVHAIESSVHGWRIFLNTTEFLIGDISCLEEENFQANYIDMNTTGAPVTTGCGIPTMVMVDNEPEKLPTLDKPLFEQKFHGIHYKEGAFPIRQARIIHKQNGYRYGLGRHYRGYNTNRLLLLWYGWSPYNEELKKRKLAIQKRIPKTDFMRGLCLEHKVTREELDDIYLNKFLPMARDLSEDLKPFI